MTTAAIPDSRAELLAAIRKVFRSTPASAEIEEDLKDLLTVTQALPAPKTLAPDAKSQKALIHLPPSNEGPLGEICALTRESARLMPWHYSYGGEDGLTDKIAFADLVGPEGPYVSNRLRLGLTLVAAHTLYKTHAHPARELYFIAFGHATWTAGAETQTPGPGAFVIHSPNIPHAMQTEMEPLLAIYVWRGDIYTPPFYTTVV